MTSVKKSCTIVTFISNMSTLMPDVASRLVVLRVLTLGAVDRLQEQKWVGEFQWERRRVGVHVLPPTSLQHHPGATSHTLGLPTAPGSMWGAGETLASPQNVRPVTEILDGLDPPWCGGRRFVVAILQLRWRGARWSAGLACLIVFTEG